MEVVGVNGARSAARHTATIGLSSRFSSKPEYSANAIILASLTSYRPDRIRCASRWSHTRDLRLADDDPTSSEPIDLIIGADLYGDIIRRGSRKGARNQPLAQNTVFGWVLSGQVASAERAQQLPTHSITVLRTLDHRLRQFWEVEELPSTAHLTPDDQACEDHFRATHARTHEGRYVVRLPFKSSPPLAIGHSFNRAKQSLQRSERRLRADVATADAYEHFMTEYESLGHMQLIAPESAASPYQPYYIPHHAVLRESSATSRLRVVFNASAVTSLGHSLNDHLHVGPKLQADLSAIIMRWRQFRCVLTADIEKMYRQILVDSRDRDYQRILWRSPASQQVQEYRLNSVTYGTRPAPFLALRVLNQLALDEGTNHPLAVSVLRHQTYVDDCIFGADDPETALLTKNQLVTVLQKGGFRLRKWASNSQPLLRSIDPRDHGLAHNKELQPDESLHVLGIAWRPADDMLHFPLRLSTTHGTTKREILSTIARFYDPLGWITPVLVTAKILLQQLWTLQCG